LFQIKLASVDLVLFGADAIFYFQPYFAIVKYYAINVNFNLEMQYLKNSNLTTFLFQNKDLMLKFITG
jgi:hypothetical protein